VNRLPIWEPYLAVFAPSLLAAEVAAWSSLVNRANGKVVNAAQVGAERGRIVRAALELACSTDENPRAVGITQLEERVMSRWQDARRERDQREGPWRAAIAKLSAYPPKPCLRTEAHSMKSMV
jgi:hypothetical protein